MQVNELPDGVWYVNEDGLNKLISKLEELDIIQTTLTRTQNECTRLLIENRELKEQLRIAEANWTRLNAYNLNEWGDPDEN